MRNIDFLFQNSCKISASKKIITEPVGKNTAPAITLAALSNLEERLMLILPVDHQINDENTFNKVLNKAIKIADENKLVTFGIVPTEPNTGYGYIEADEEENFCSKIKSFHEKPNLNKAKEYIKNDNYFWNSGMFLFNSKKYISELKKYREDIYLSCKKSLSKVKKIWMVY